MEHMMWGPGALFLFLGIGSVGLFATLAFLHWLGYRTEERLGVERLALLRRLTEVPSESASQVLGYLREEDAKREEAERRKAAMKREGTKGAGLVLVAVSVGLGLFLWAIVPDMPVWTLALAPGLAGVVLFMSWRAKRSDTSA